MPGGYAAVERDDQALPSWELKTPVYLWQNKEVEPKAVAIAVHGLTLHGLIYDRLATHLADQGFIVLAPDLHGYGRWSQKQASDDKCPDCHSHLCYTKSKRDVEQLVIAAKGQYPTLPIYLIGESLGADIAIYTTARHPELVNGMVLSSPAIKHSWNMASPLFKDVAILMRNPFHEVNLVPYIKRWASEDPEIIAEAVNDPLVRKRLTIWDLLKTHQAMKPTLQYADKVPTTVPVLIIQGDKDRMLKTNAVVQLLKHLNCQDQTVRWFTNRGHLLLETSHLQPDTVKIVDLWLQEHVGVNVVKAHASVHGQLKMLTDEEPEQPSMPGI